MRGHRAEALRRSLHLSIDAAVGPYHHSAPSVSETDLSPISSTRASIATSNTSWSGSNADCEPAAAWPPLAVLCLYDFASDDPDHLPFRKGDVLDVVRQEDAGWWAAVRRGTERVGWIPSAFVQELTDDEADALHRPRDTMKVWQPEDDEDDGSMPLFRGPKMSESDTDSLFQELLLTAQPKERDIFIPTFINSAPFIPENGFGMPVPDTGQDRSYPPQSVSTSPPAPQTAPVLSKPLPLRLETRDLRRKGSVTRTHNSSETRLASSVSQSTGTAVDPSDLSTDDDELAHRSPRLGKVRQITGEAVAEKIASAKHTQARLPWYLRNSYRNDELNMEFDGVVKAGTVRALVERLTAEQLSPQQEKAYRHTFLTTFRTFTTADELFTLLRDMYETDHPPDLTEDEFEDWKEKKLRPIQKRVLFVLGVWLEEHDMLHQEPHVARRVQEFLTLINAPPSLAQHARAVLRILERLTFASPDPPAAIISPSRRKRHRLHRGDLAKMDPLSLAQQLTMIEFRLFVKIKPHECMNWIKTQTGPGVQNLLAFCETHEKLAAWVKSSVLGNDSLGKRADAVDFWIKVAEKCRAINNFSSMFAIVASLSSGVLSRLHLTWAHVGRATQLDTLAKLLEPGSNFSAYRSTLAGIEYGPCIPFIGMFLSDLVHTHDQHPDVILTERGITLVHFVKRQRWADAVLAMLRHQTRPYALAEEPLTAAFVEGQLASTAGKDPQFFWSRSQELHQAELAHADIRKGLEAAGF